MKRFFQKLLHNCTGALTVFVTLLLIPAVLVSGTGVDIARIYTARSVLQDGNQLAANSVLASYDALLQDLYGLYGVMKDDPEFARMADSYIQTAVLGKSPKDTGLGTFQLFYGSDLQSGDVVPADGMNLDNPQVLRRQIEEYAKFRAPVIIVQEILGRLDVFQSVQEDAKVIQDKLEVDQKVEQVEKIYRSIYDCIQKVNEAKGQEESAIASVNSHLDQIRQELQGMIDAREGYLRLVGDPALPREIPVGLQPGQAFTIGRFDVSVGHQQSDYEFDKQTKAVSRHHAAIEREQDGCYTLVDLDSKAGTFLNGERLTPNVPVPLTRGSRVSFGTGGADYIWEE